MLDLELPDLEPVALTAPEAELPADGFALPVEAAEEPDPALPTEAFDVADLDAAALLMPVLKRLIEVQALLAKPLTSGLIQELL